MNEAVNNYGNMSRKTASLICIYWCSSDGKKKKNPWKNSMREQDLLTKNISINNVTPPRPQRENSPLTSLEARSKKNVLVCQTVRVDSITFALLRKSTAHSKSLPDCRL